MIPARATLWRKAAAATLSDLGKRVRSLAGEAARRIAIGISRARIATGVAADRFKTQLRHLRNNFALRAAAFRTAVTEQRHGTWLILFGLLFTLLWLGAGWIGMANGLWRALAVGIATPVIVNALFPLKRPR